MTLSAGAIHIIAAMDGDVVRHVGIVSDRPVSLASAMTGRPVAAVGAAMAALHSLCGQSHAAAVRFAAAAAMDRAVPEQEVCDWVVRLAGERLAEHFRGLFIAGARAGGVAGDATNGGAYDGADDWADDGADDWAGARGGAAACDAAGAAVFRAAIGAAQQVARTGTVAADTLARIDGGIALISRSGRHRPGGHAPGSHAPGSPALGRDVVICGPDPVDALNRADDGAVVEALAGDPDFIRFPRLARGVPETGPPTRQGCSAADPARATAARVAEIRIARALLADRPSAMPDGWISAGSVGPCAGYSAVETPRGRLYYRLVVRDDGHLRDARVLAPTEWNFHPAGPLTRALAGFRPGADAVAAIARRTAAFDPCVAFKVTVDA